VRGAAVYWLEEAPPEPAACALAGEAEADVAIVGGGYTGLWTALALKQRAPELQVVVLEADVCGHGPSGRNGGFLHGYWSRLPLLRERFGDSGALEVARVAEGAIDAVRELDEDVWFREGGFLKVSAAPAQDESVEALVRAARELGVEEEAVPLDREQVAGRIRSPRLGRGVFVRRAGTVQPARLVRALRGAALAAGVQLHERSPVRRVDQGRIETERSTVRSRDVVVATSTWRPLQRRLTIMHSACVITEPDAVVDVGWTGGEAVVDGRMFAHYFRTTPDGRVLMGSGAGSTERAEAGLRALLPAVTARVTHRWDGPIDISSDQLPFFGSKGHVHYGAGYSGSGVGPSWLGGQILASLALGADDEWTQLPLVHRDVPKLPPEPLKRLGTAPIRAATIAVEDNEQNGHRTSAALRAVAALPRVLGIPLGRR
jgi:glycine/D-amino acid oxidase-like deaminating enzyme